MAYPRQTAGAVGLVPLDRATRRGSRSENRVVSWLFSAQTLKHKTSAPGIAHTVFSNLNAIVAGFVDVVVEGYSARLTVLLPRRKDHCLPVSLRDR